MDKLSNKEIIEIIKEYVCSPHTNGAILINGDWGSGKTYFVKNKVKKTIETDCNKELVYISLYGISSCNEIIKQLFIQTTPIIKKSDNTHIKKGSAYAKMIFGAGLSFFGIDSDKLIPDYEKLLDIDNSKYLLIFDDLERCKTNIIEILGFINNFIEHDEIKTIIIANEEEISNQNLINNYEQKMLAASYNNPNKSVKELEEKVKAMFSQNEAYKAYKEKVISQEIRYECNMEEVLPELISSFIDKNEQTKSFLLENQDSLIEELKKREHFNLRTVIFILTLFEKLSSGILNHFNSECNKEIISKILQDNFRSLICESVDFKYPPKVKEDMNYRLKYHFDRFSYIIDLVSTSIYFTQDLIDSMNIQYKKYQSSYLTIRELKNNWSLINDSEVIEKYDLIKEEILSNKYSVYSCFESIELLIEINNLGFGFDYKYIVEYIQNKINKSDSLELQKINIEIKQLTPFKPNSDYLKIINDFKEVIINKETQSVIEKVNSYFDMENWGEQLFQYLKDKDINQVFLSKKRFFYMCDIKKLIIAINRATEKDIYYFRYALSIIYDFENIIEFYNIDYKNLKIFHAKLISLKKKLKGKIKIMQIEYLLKQVEELISRLEIKKT